jgi:hypothetical protein
MSDDNDIIVDAPDSHAPSSGAEGAIREIKELAQKTIETSPDIDTADFAEEMADKKEEESGKELSKARKEARRERYQRALEAARTAEHTPTVDKRDALERKRDQARDDEGRFEAGESDQSDPRAQVPEDWETQLRKRDASIAASTAYHMRAAEFAKVVPDYQSQVEATFGIFPPRDDIAQALLDSEIGPALAFELASDIDLLDAFNNLPPARITAGKSERVRNTLMHTAFPNSHIFRKSSLLVNQARCLAWRPYLYNCAQNEIVAADKSRPLRNAFPIFASTIIIS